MGLSEALPKWFRLGAWVTDGTGPEKAVGQIRRIDLDEEVVYVDWARWDGRPCPPTLEIRPLRAALRPVRFRQPTFEEGVAFLGKAMVLPGKERRHAVLLVDVSQVMDDCGNLLTTFNRSPWECLQSCTVDGLPFGVAEIEEDGK